MCRSVHKIDPARIAPPQMRIDQIKDVELVAARSPTGENQLLKLADLLAGKRPRGANMHQNVTRQHRRAQDSLRFSAF